MNPYALGPGFTTRAAGPLEPQDRHEIPFPPLREMSAGSPDPGAATSIRTDPSSRQHGQRIPASLRRPHREALHRIETALLGDFYTHPT